MPISSIATSALLPHSLTSPEIYSERTQITPSVPLASSSQQNVSANLARPYSIVATAERWKALHGEYVQLQKGVMPRLSRTMNILMKEAGIPMATTLATTTTVYLASQMVDPTSWSKVTGSDAIGQTTSAEPSDKSSWSNGERSALIGGLLGTAATLVKDLIPALFEAGKKAYSEDDVEGPIKVLRHIHTAFKKEEEDYLKENDIPQANKKALEKLNTEIDRIITASLSERQMRMGDGFGDTIYQTVRAHLEKYVWIRAIPLKAKNISHMEKDGDLEARRRIDQNVKALVAGYEPGLRSRLTDYVATIRQKSLDGSGASLLYLAGSPGTGKTHLAKNLAQALELPYIKIMAKGKRLEQIFGEQDRDNFYYGGVKETPFIEKLGDFFVNLIASYPNAIIHLEEFGDEFNSETVSQILQDLKERLDREKLEIPELNNAVIPNLLNIVVTSNTTLTPDMLPEHSRDSLRALMSRMTYLEMPAIPSGLKQTLAEKAWDTAIENLRRNANPVEPIAELKDEVIALLLKEDAERDVPGTRLVERITGAVASQLFSKKYDEVYDMTSTGHEISTDQVKQIIKERYDESLLNEKAKAGGTNSQFEPMFGGFSPPMGGGFRAPIGAGFGMPASGVEFRRSMASLRSAANGLEPATGTSAHVDEELQTESAKVLQEREIQTDDAQIEGREVKSVSDKEVQTDTISIRLRATLRDRATSPSLGTR